MRVWVLTLDPPIIIDTDTYSGSQTGTINPLNGSVLATASNGGSSFSTALAVTSTWNSASSGSVIFEGSIVADNFPDGPSGLGSYTKAGPSIWTYSFIPDTDGKFSFYLDSYGSLINTYNNSTVFNYDFISFQYFRNNTNNWINLQKTDPDTLSFDITAGVPFKIGFGWIHETVGLGGIGPIEFNAYGAFQLLFDTAPASAVPEPTTMLLFGTGLAGLAVVGRRMKV